MSMATEVEVRMAGVAVEDRPSLARVVATWNVNVEGDHWILGGDDPETLDAFADRYSEQTEGDTFAVGYHDKWETEGVKEFALALTKRFPEIEVYVNLEWTGDEPSIERASYKAGRIIAALPQTMQPVAIATERMPLGFSTSDILNAYDAFDGDDVSYFTESWDRYLDGSDLPCNERGVIIGDGIHSVTDGSCDKCGSKNRS